MTESIEFEQFMSAYQDMVYTVALRLVGRHADALDVAQETFVKAFAHFDYLRDNPAAGGWIKRVATNLCLNHLSRYRARWRFFSELFNPGEECGGVDALVQSESESEGREETEHRRFYLERALRRLPSTQRVPLVLYHFEELSYEEIASRLGISLSKVKTDIHRARLALRRWLSPQAPLSDEEGAAGEVPLSWGEALLPSWRGYGTV